MAKLSISLFLSLWVLFLVLGSCLARRDQPQQNECQLEQLESLEPDNVIEADAGWIETWNPNHRQFRCAGVALSRCTLEQHALRMPSYSNSPQLIFIRRGRGLLGMVIPGCANTYEESQQSGSGQSWRSRDRHQKIRRFRQGDVIAVPAGISFWMYNSENENVEAIHLLDISSHQNQLDQTPRRFYLAGKQQQEFLQYQEGGGRQQQQQEEQEEQRQQQQGGQQEQGQGQEQQHQQQGGNMLSGFDRDWVAQAFNADNDTARQLQGENDLRKGGIIRVKGGLDIFRGQGSQQQQQEQEQEEDEDAEERQQQQQEEDRRGRSREERGSDNGLEETLCSLRLRQNIGKSTSPDIYHPHAGSLRTVNSFDLPILRSMKLSAEFGSLHNNALYVPHYNLNANSIMYALEGRAQIQVVDCSGNSVYNKELNEGQALLVPQNYAVAIRSHSEHFLWVTFKTNDIAMVATLPNLIQGWPEEVVAHVYQLRRKQARRLKNNSPLHFLIPPQQSPRVVA